MTTATRRSPNRNGFLYGEKIEYIDGFRYVLEETCVAKCKIVHGDKFAPARYESVSESWHNTREEAEQTFTMIVADAKAVEFAKQCATWIPADVAGDFLPALAAGDATALMGLADHLSDTRGELDVWTLIVKSAFHRGQGEKNVSVKVGKIHIVLNCDGYNAKRPLTAVVTPGESIRLLTVNCGQDWKEGNWVERHPELVDRTYRIGDTGTTGSYNLVYMEKIAKITAKTVQFEASHSGHGEKTFKIHQFAADHWDFDEVKALKRNSEWMD
jgi:hypothetical protein